MHIRVYMNWYDTIEIELEHVRNAILILERKRGQFPPSTVVGDPKYWSTRLQDIRDRAERN
ncbi:hypothetical protein WI58_33870 [Burkholderia cepacia]|nr:hypothetical protein WI48_20200 [Burkholderia cepacia]KVA55947.1 hypothetical protein WI49_33405 [Burkholderia cepacia]KVA79246.1 hypothetical protein WI50_28180 [Burkholderia cepacia]KVA83232.1 hypothetical protein WI52_17020 [Burkholderia cepacia]KVA91643.1 hypothetical protein WI51_08920 [Burkholderia cepacia]